MTVHEAPALAMFRAALFDMDGVLVDTHRAITSLWQRLAATNGVDLTTADIERDVVGCAPEHTVATVFGALPEAARRRVLAEVVAAEPELAFDELPGARALVSQLHRAGVLLGLVTGGSRRRVLRVLDRLELRSVFAGIIAWGDVAHGKPAPDCYLLGAERIGVAASDCLVFEDATSGVRAAVAAGATCIGIGDLRLAEHGAWKVAIVATELRCRTDGQDTELLHAGSVLARFPRRATR
jgi:sugar-phosphatase